MAKEEQHLVTNSLNNNNNNTINSNTNSNDSKSMSSLIPLRNSLLNDKQVSRSSSPGSVTIISNRVSLQKLSAEKRAKRIKFYLNGDKFYKGLVYAFNPEKVRTFDALCQDLTRVLGHHVRHRFQYYYYY